MQRRQYPQASFRDLVVVTPPSITRNPPRGLARRRRRLGSIGEAEHHNASRTREHRLWIAIGFRAIDQIMHLARIAGGQPLEKMVDPRRRYGGANAGQGEAERRDASALSDRVRVSASME